MLALRVTIQVDLVIPGPPKKKSGPPKFQISHTNTQHLLTAFLASRTASRLAGGSISIDRQHLRGSHLARNHEGRRALLAPGGGIGFSFEGLADSESSTNIRFAVFAGPITLTKCRFPVFVDPQ